MKEPLILELFRTLQAQVDALADGTNPVVYFPVGTKKLPTCPSNAKCVNVPGDAAGCGTYYYLPRITSAKVIIDAVERGDWGGLLGFVQRKEDALKGCPGLMVARDFEGCEVKSAVIDVNDKQALIAQRIILSTQFPSAEVKVEPMQRVMLERIRDMAAVGI